jgi:hypothetical protein
MATNDKIDLDAELLPIWQNKCTLESFEKYVEKHKTTLSPLEFAEMEKERSDFNSISVQFFQSKNK